MENLHDWIDANDTSLRTSVSENFERSVPTSMANLLS